MADRAASRKRHRQADNDDDIKVKNEDTSSSSSIPKQATTLSSTTQRLRFFDDCMSHPQNSSLERVTLATISPRQFFERYIGPRQPCILVCQDDDDDQFALSTTSLQHHAGDIPVQVEQRPSRAVPFGQGARAEVVTTMTVAQLLHQLRGKATTNKKDPSLYYLSTQVDETESEDEDEAVTTLSPLVRRLMQRRQLPVSWPWAGHLVLESCHVWMGSSSGTASHSGLHHDFHDNFYLVQAGCKEWYIAPPTTVFLPTHGNTCPTTENTRIVVVGDDAPNKSCPILTTIYPNGVRCYACHPTRADGVPLSRSSRTDKEPESMDNQDDDDDDDDDDEEEVVLGKGFDYVSSDEDDEPRPDPMRDDWEDEEDEDVNSRVNAGSDDENKDGKRGDDDENTTHDNKDDDNAAKEKWVTSATAGGARSSSTTTMPSSTPAEEEELTTNIPRPHFSPLDVTTTSWDDACRQFPTLAAAPQPPTFTHVCLQAGEGLYLPASWFHCVVSSSASVARSSAKGEDDDDETGASTKKKKNQPFDPPPDTETTRNSTNDNKGTTSSTTTEEDEENSNIHLSVNYWYHPPDQLDNFEQPYQDVDFWKVAQRRADLEQQFFPTKTDKKEAS